MIPRTMAAPARLACMWLLVACATVPAHAQTTPYSLAPGAEFRTGCFFPPCVCAPVQDALTGDLTLIRKPPVAQFSQYDIVGADWVIQFPQGLTVNVTGSGHYKFGGSGVIQQQMTLDLSFAGGPVRHFDSGLVAGGQDFPRIDVTLSLFGFMPCGDTVLRIRAVPGTAGVGALTAKLESLAPNPFRTAIRLELSMLEPGPLRVTVHDIAGRWLKTLADDEWLDRGTRSVVWDGLRADGRSCAAGRYYMRVQAGGRSEQRSIVKLH